MGGPIQTEVTEKRWQITNCGHVGPDRSAHSNASNVSATTFQKFSVSSNNMKLIRPAGNVHINIWILDTFVLFWLVWVMSNELSLFLLRLFESSRCQIIIWSWSAQQVMLSDYSFQSCQPLWHKIRSLCTKFQEFQYYFRSSEIPISGVLILYQES